MFTIKNQLHELTSWSIIQCCHFRQPERHSISQQGPVHPVCKKNPSLMFTHSEDLGLGIQFEGIRLFRICPCTVSPTPDSCCHIQINRPVRIINLYPGIRQPIFEFAWDLTSIRRFDKDDRQTGIPDFHHERIFQTTLDHISKRLGKIIDGHSTYLLYAIHIHLCSMTVK